MRPTRAGGSLSASAGGVCAQTPAETSSAASAHILVHGSRTFRRVIVFSSLM